MTTLPRGDQPADEAATDASTAGAPSPAEAFAAALSSGELSGGETPLLGHLVLYSIFDGQVSREALERWFAELGLDPTFVPPPLRAVDAFERVTGPDGVRVRYPLDPPAAAGGAGQRGGRARRDALVGRSASLMVRPVRRDGGQIVRHVVREVRDEEHTSLSYDTRLGVCVFHRDTSAGSQDGAGTLQVEPDRAAIAALPEAEQATVRGMLTDVEDSYRRRCRYLTGDRLRSVIRRYVEALTAIRVRKTGGVYFVHRQHADTLAALRELVGRFGEGSHLVRIPLPDQDEMREMVISAFTTKAKDDLDKLAGDISAAARGGQHGEVDKLYHRFTELAQATDEHSRLLSTSLDDATASLQLVKAQLGSLLATTGAEDTDRATDDEAAGDA